MKNAQQLSDAIDLIDAVRNSAALCVPERNMLTNARALIADVHFRITITEEVYAHTKEESQHALRHHTK